MLRIGISMDRALGDRPLAQLDLRYARALHAAGAMPVLLPPEAELALCMAAELDALLLTGGDGLPESLLGGAGDLPQDLPPAHPERIRSELALLREMRRRGRPVLGVCFGMQLLNLEAGGTLSMEIPGHSPKRGHARHPLELRSGSALERLAGRASGLVNSSHLQAVDRLGTGFEAVAWAADGVVEAIEAEGGGRLGVQWHPEREEGAFGDTLLRRWLAQVRASG